MGANQSSGDGRSDADGNGLNTESKTCYYELLEVEAKATGDEIKKAYRRKALELHPDRNFGDVEWATKRFADVQAAYEVLSDPQERAWYDAHRDNILHGGVDNEESFEYDIRITTAEEVLRFLSKIDFRTDSSVSAEEVFTAVQDFFDRLAKEEEAASRCTDFEPVQYPPFGESNDAYEDTIRPFYATWSNFATAKSFSWKDRYRYSEAPDRKIRRLMEKENKRLRDDSIREFNDAVRSVVAFIRKRDPRSKLNKQSEADRQKVLRDAAMAQAARSRAANQAKLADQAIPEWMNPTSSEPAVISDDDDEKDESKSSRHEIECVVCDKIFKSEKQYEAHEKSKKHTKAVQHLRRQMIRENQDLKLHDEDKTHDKFASELSTLDLRRDQSSLDSTGLGYERSDPVNPVEITEQTGIHNRVGSNAGVEPFLSESDSTQEEGSHADTRSEHEFSEQNESIGDDLSPKRPLDNPAGQDLSGTPFAEPINDDTEILKQPKMGKAKEKRAKKALQMSMLATTLNDAFICSTCKQSFTSKTQLFKHIKAVGHAQPIGNGRQSAS